MTVTIEKSTASGTVVAPPSKSMAHRYLICAALGDKGSVISSLEASKDILATVECLRSLGAKIDFDGKKASVAPISDRDGEKILPCNESGSTLRFLIPLGIVRGGKVTLTGTKRLFERSLDVYKDICEKQGVAFTQSDTSVTLCGSIKSGEYRVRGDISSQFISGLMFALPLLDGDSDIILTSPLESASYIDLTVKALADYGVEIEKREYGWHVRGNQKYRARDITVEGDYSNAAFFDALNLLGGSVTVTNLAPDSLQGDRVYRRLFGKIGGDEVIDISDCPDLAPVLFALAAAKGGGRFTGTRRLKIKESDRAEAMAQELGKFGIEVEVGDNDVRVKNGKLCEPETALSSHNDHRIAMALAVLCTVTGGRIEGAEAVSKSLPDFFDRLAKTGIKVTTDET